MSHKNPHDFESEVLRRQKNTLWPDTLKNGITVDGFLWNGAKRTTPIQRAGAMVFGFAFIGAGFALLCIAGDKRSLLVTAVACVFAMGGWRVFTNGLSPSVRDKLRSPVMVLIPFIALLTYLAWPLLQGQSVRGR